MSVDIRNVPPEQIDAVWPSVSAHIERGLQHGAGDSTTAEALYMDVVKGKKTLWAIMDGSEVVAATILELVERPYSKVIFVVMVAGQDFHKWSDDLQRLLLDAKEILGADAIEAMVRPGIRKWLSRMGWKPKATLMRCEG